MTSEKLICHGLNLFKQSFKNLAKRSVSSSSSRMPSFYNNRVIEQMASKQSQRVTLRQLTVFGRTISPEKLIKSANYIRQELPVRVAQRLVEFQHLPFIVGSNPHIENTYNLYQLAFDRFRQFPEVTNLEQNREFCTMLHEMLNEHLAVIPQLALGISESTRNSHISPDEADRFMDAMLRSRIGRRVLAEQHITLSEIYDGEIESLPDFIGIVNTKCKGTDVVNKCTNLIRQNFVEAYGIIPPEVSIDGHIDASFTYIPDQIEYIIFELLKNSVEATIRMHTPESILREIRNNGRKMVTLSQNGQAWDLAAAMRTADDEGIPVIEHVTFSRAQEQFQGDHDDFRDKLEKSHKIEMPKVRVTLSLSDDTFTFRISDQGGGIPLEMIKHIYSYSHPSKTKFMNFERVPVFAGKVGETVETLGLGLPMSKVYATYWGGSLDVHSMRGYGTDVYVSVKVGNQIEKFNEIVNLRGKL